MSSKYYFNEICMTYQAAAKVDLRHLLVDFHAHIVDVVGFVCWCECSGCARVVFSIFLASSDHSHLVLSLRTSTCDLIWTGATDQRLRNLFFWLVCQFFYLSLRKIYDI